MVTGVVVEKVPPAPLSVKVTVTPEIPLPYLSASSTISFLANIVLGCADWLFPCTMVSAVAGPGTDCSVMFTVAGLSVAVTVMIFADVGSVKVVLACPFVPVIAGLGEKLPFNPESANVIGAPTTMTPEEFLALTVMGSGKTVPTVPTCLPPETTVTVATAGVEVSVKLADVYPVAVAVTVMVFAVDGNV